MVWFFKWGKKIKVEQGWKWIIELNSWKATGSNKEHSFETRQSWGFESCSVLTDEAGEKLLLPQSQLLHQHVGLEWRLHRIAVEITIVLRIRLTNYMLHSKCSINVIYLWRQQLLTELIHAKRQYSCLDAEKHPFLWFVLQSSLFLVYLLVSAYCWQLEGSVTLLICFLHRFISYIHRRKGR